MKRYLHVGERYALSKRKPIYLTTKYFSLLAVLSLMCLYAAKQASAQQAEPAAPAMTDIKPLQIGDTIPEWLWQKPLQVVNHPEGKKIITLNDYRAKLIILDFWATWCSNCLAKIKELHLINSEDSHADIAIISVSTQKAKEIETFFSQGRFNGPQFLSIVDDTLFNKLLPHTYIPHGAIVYNNTLITDYLPDDLDNQSVKTFVRNGRMEWEKKIDMAMPAFLQLNKNSEHAASRYAVLTEDKRKNKAPTWGSILDSANCISRFYAHHYTLKQLVSKLYGEYDIPNSYINIKRDAIATIGRDSMMSLLNEQKYFFDATYSVGLNEEELFRCALADISRLLGLSFDRQTIRRDCYVVKEGPTGTLDAGTVRGMRLTELIGYLNASSDLPPVLTDMEFKSAYNWRLDINTLPTPITIDWLSTKMKASGLQLVRESRDIPSLYITEYRPFNLKPNSK